MKKENKKARGKDLALLITGTLFLMIFCVAGTMLCRYYKEYSNQQEKAVEVAALREADLQAAEETAKGSGKEAKQLDLSVDNSLLAKMNPDYVGWITVPDTEIYYPMVQRDNAYYLTHDFKGEYDRHGAIFLDENCETTDEVLLIHGHHMKDGTMFAALKGYKKQSFLEEHEIIYLDFGGGDVAYEVFAVALVDLSVEGYFSYDNLPDDEGEKERYLTQLKNNSVWYEAPQDAMIILSIP